MEKERIVYLDVLRVLATFMVIMVHLGDAYIYDGATMTFGKESTWFAVLLRSSVPLFIIMSSILLLPIKTDTTTFFKRRFTRVFIPFLIWSLIYVFLPIPNEVTFGGPENAFTHSGMNVYLYNLMMIPLNFTASNIHFWFIYIILGIYLFMPIISPWIKTASKKSLLFFLGLWCITLFFPYIRWYFPEIHGESDWNEFGMFYYFGGYLGYVILGYFLHYYNRLRRSTSMALGAVFFVVGVLLTYFGFLHDQEVFLETLQNSGVEDWKSIEFHINFLSPNVVLMTAGVFMFFQNMKLSPPMARLITEFSIFSYGIFLVHYIISLWIGDLLRNQLPLNAGLEQFLLAILTFILSYAIVKVLAMIPKSKYLIG